jgi:hypothetical protein
MPNPWMPGLRHDPGRGAGYNAGQNSMEMWVDHSTQGTDSYYICKWGREGYRTGLCQILFPKVGIPWQFMEIDAVAYHAGSAAYGDYNPKGPGYEVERLFIDGVWEDLTPDQSFWIAEVNQWGQSEWGLPNMHYWGPQFPAWGADYHGHVNHSQIHPNNDGFTKPEWDSLGTAETPAPRKEGTDMILVVVKGDGYWCRNGQFWVVSSPDYARQVGQGQTYEQVLGDWGFLPTGPLPAAMVDEWITSAIAETVRRKKLDKSLASITLP